MMQTEELKPCPFCGGEAELITRNMAPDAFVKCENNCPRMCSDDEKAIDEWNKRAKEE